MSQEPRSIKRVEFVLQALVWPAPVGETGLNDRLSIQFGEAVPSRPAHCDDKNRKSRESESERTHPHDDPDATERRHGPNARPESRDKIALDRAGRFACL